jgi:hypothetical protein
LGVTARDPRKTACRSLEESLPRQPGRIEALAGGPRVELGDDWLEL